MSTLTTVQQLNQCHLFATCFVNTLSITKDINMQKPESIVQIIHTHVLKFLHFSTDYANKTLCTHTIFYSEVGKKILEIKKRKKKSVHGLRPKCV